MSWRVGLLLSAARMIWAGFISLVLVKYIDAKVTPLQQTTGVLTLASVAYLICWLASRRAYRQDG